MNEASGATAPRRGRLRVLLGAAPGVGKTCQMLEEGRRLAEEGADVVVGLVETHGRRGTAALVGDLEVLPRRRLHQGTLALEELDVDAVLARRPRIVLVDELAHTNAPGMGTAKRWEDVEQILAAGIDVITTVNVQHIESLNDVVRDITGITQRETVPDEVVRQADSIEVIDLEPESLRERLAAGQVYPAERIDAALTNYFRLGNLTALREMALLWVAEGVESSLERYRREHNITGKWEARERIVVALSGGEEGEGLLRRGARIASRSVGGQIIAVHVSRPDGLVPVDAAALQRQRTLTAQLGGTFHQIVGEDTAAALIEFARGANATQLVIGASRHSPLRRLLGGSTAQSVIRSAGLIDVHIVSVAAAAERMRLPATSGGVTARRRTLASALALLALPALSLALWRVNEPQALSTIVLLYQLLVVVTAMIGGMWPALACALASGLLLDYLFMEPLYLVTIADPRHLAALALYVLNGVLVSVVVDRLARTVRAARRRATEADLLSSVAGSMLRTEQPVQEVVERIREAFGLQEVVLQGPQGRIASAGQAPPSGEAQRPDRVEVGEETWLEVRGGALSGADARLLRALADLLEVELNREDLGLTAQAMQPIAEADRVRRALLAAVGHDFRRPLAAATTAVMGLRDPRITDPEDRRELLETAEDSLASLTDLVTNLLDVSRLQSGAMAVHLEDVDVDEIIVRALDETAIGPDRIDLMLDSALPPCQADPALLERVLVNLLTNTQRHAAGAEVLLRTSHAADRIEIRVVDRGPGIAPEERQGIFRAFQREDDTDATSGLGLGLSVCRGFAAGMGGSLEAEETPGGGLTMVLTLRTSASGSPAAPVSSAAPVASGGSEDEAASPEEER